MRFHQDSLEGTVLSIGQNIGKVTFFYTRHLRLPSKLLLGKFADV